MILAPTQRAVLLLAAGAPVALLLGVMLPAYWTVGLYWMALILALSLVDALLCAPGGKISVTPDQPTAVSVGESFVATITASFPPKAMIRSPEIALAVSANLDPGVPVRGPLVMDGEQGQAAIPLTPVRRGKGQISAIWLRWRGPFGLIARQRQFVSTGETLVTPDIRAIRSDGIRLFQRDAMHGLIAQLERGEGTDFEALTDYRAGMDKRAIDWKQSARHAHLLAKEYRTERDNRIVFAVDCGRVMSEPLAGVPRVDRAISAALLTAWTALKLGDRASLYAFDSRPRLHSGALTGAQNFAQLQRLASTIDYSSDETNHVLAMSNLSQQLNRRALIILFTDFTDPTGADLLVRALGWLMVRHLVLFVVMRDADLVDMVEAEPVDTATIVRAVAAASLINEQRKVIARLRRLGLEVIEAEHGKIGLQLVNAYIALKQRGRL